MARVGNLQFTMILTVPERLEEEGDRIFRSHAAWMERTHYRDGEKALLIYDLSKAPEKAEPFDPDSAGTGNLNYILSEVYRGSAGLVDHWQQAGENWEDFATLKQWMSQGQVHLVNGAGIKHSLW